jgi:outer membrane receptor protein involved in Fe transport
MPLTVILALAHSLALAQVSEASADQGTVLGIVLGGDGTPLAGVMVRSGGASTTTDQDGVFSMSLPAGIADLEVGNSARIPAVPVVHAASTEVLVTLRPEGPLIDIEAPAEAKSRAGTAMGPPGELEGIVRERGTRAPVAGVRVFARGAAVTSTTGADGKFRVTLPSGAWDLSLVRAGFGAVTQAAEVAAGRSTTIEIDLDRVGLDLDELVVTAPKITGGTASALEERRDAATVSDVLGAEQMSRAGDSDAASALKRVTGLTVVGGKYVYVRGLGDRYSATLLNGSSLPSPEPEKRVVPLDIFPTSLVERVVIQKGASPDRPAELGGGVVEVETRDIPSQPVLDLGISGTYVSGTSFGTGLLGPEQETDWLGFGTEARALPASVADASADEPLKAQGRFTEGGYSAEELEQFGEAIPNRWGLSERDIPPDAGLTANAGGRLRLGRFTLGGLAGGVYSNAWDVEEGVRSVFADSGDGLVESRRTTFSETTNAIRVGGALAVGADWDERFSLRSTTLLNRASEATGQIFTADDPSGLNDSRTRRSGWTEQEFLFEQLTTSLDFGKVKLDGRLALAAASREEPDRRDWTQLLTEDGSYILSQRAGWNDIQYASLRDEYREGGVDITIPLRLLGRDHSVKLGGLRATRERASGTRRFAYQFKGSDGIDLGAPVEEVIVPENIGKEDDADRGYLQVEENTINTDDYSAGQEMYAAYAMADAALLDRLRASGGVRFERSEQSVSTFEQFDTENEPVVATLGSSDWLPSATISLDIGPAAEPGTMLVRAGYGRTLSRPEFRELTEVQYYDYRTGRTLYGNPELHRAVIENADLRWEWYPRAEESVSAGGFFKYFDQPIESVVAVSAVSGSVGTFANATSATNVGAEVDWRIRLDRAADLLADFYVAGNVALISSEVDLSGTEGNQTSDRRPLQGQSPWVLNLQVSYENPDVRTGVSLLYNATGPRIVDVGTSGIPDAYEMPVHRLDAAWTQGIGRHLRARVKASNILDWPAVQMVGERVSEETTSGWSVGASLAVAL